MSGQSRIYCISLCYEAYFCKTMDVAAKSLSEACEFAMQHADDGPVWKDTLASSSHWIESIDGAMDLVPDEYCAEGIRCGGAEISARRLHEALSSLVQACEQDAMVLGAIRSDVERAKAALTNAGTKF